ncbi:SAV_915 family protein [Streptomyces sp. NPDC059740]|uniref:SAV_915 family protein n=1 Tax=Streptomyces sp. NPDC059740 TaxID=3346926 RepID=UPI00365ECFED
MSGERSGRRPTAAPVLYVPVRQGPKGCVARLFRTPRGGRTAVGFTSAQRLRSTLGAAQRWVRLAEPALRALTEPLGAAAVIVDPVPQPRPRTATVVREVRGPAFLGPRRARPLTAAAGGAGSPR